MLRRSSPLLSAALLGLAAGCASDGRFAEPRDYGRSSWERLRQVNARVGALELDDERWGRLDTPTVLAIDYVETVGWDWLGLEGGLEWAYDEAGTTEPLSGERVEESLAFAGISAGVLASPPPDLYRLRPYVGAGGSLLWTDVDSLVDDALLDDDDTVLGGYAKAGLLLQITESTHVGVEVRWLDTGAISAGSQDLPLDGMLLSLVFGATFDWFAW